MFLLPSASQSIPKVRVAKAGHLGSQGSIQQGSETQSPPETQLFF